MAKEKEDYISWFLDVFLLRIALDTGWSNGGKLSEKGSVPALRNAASLALMAAEGMETQESVDSRIRSICGVFENIKEAEMRDILGVVTTRYEAWRDRGNGQFLGIMQDAEATFFADQVASNPWEKTSDGVDGASSRLHSAFRAAVERVLVVRSTAELLEADVALGVESIVICASRTLVHGLERTRIEQILREALENRKRILE